MAGEKCPWRLLILIKEFVGLLFDELLVAARIGKRT
jgi:hypothetical protein